MTTANYKLRAMLLICLGSFATLGAAQQTTPEEAAADLEPAVNVSDIPRADLEPAVNVSDTPRVAEAVAPVAATTSGGTSGVMDQLDLGTTSITGNQELPKVLYIVPWKDPGLGELVGKPVNSLVDEVLAPVDRDVFLRQTTYFDQLYGGAEAEPGG